MGPSGQSLEPQTAHSSLPPRSTSIGARRLPLPPGLCGAVHHQHGAQHPHAGPTNRRIIRRASLSLISNTDTPLKAMNTLRLVDVWHESNLFSTGTGGYRRGPITGNRWSHARGKTAALKMVPCSWQTTSIASSAWSSVISTSSTRTLRACLASLGPRPRSMPWNTWLRVSRTISRMTTSGRLRSRRVGRSGRSLSTWHGPRWIVAAQKAASSQMGNFSLSE
jgi:hypothetical protein